MAVPGRDTVHQGLSCGFIRGIERKEFQALVVPDGGSQGGCFIFSYVSCYYGRSFMQKGQGHGASEPACSARDQGNFACEFSTHASLLTSDITLTITVIN